MRSNHDHYRLATWGHRSLHRIPKQSLASMYQELFWRSHADGSAGCKNHDPDMAMGFHWFRKPHYESRP
jgi:hypothetical protein